MPTEEFCFVIMPLTEETKEVYFDAIKPAVESKGLKCIRIDEIVDTGNITKRIVEYITKAKMIIADLTGKNPSVLYELGIAHALGNNVIVITKNRQDIPYDVESYHIIEYQDTIAGGRVLHRKITQSIDNVNEWSMKPNNPVQDFLPEKIVSIGQHTDTVEELQDVKEKLSSAQIHLQEYEKIKTELSEIKKSYNTMWEKAKELEILQRLITPLFLGGQRSNQTDFIHAVQEVVERIQKEGEVSISVPSSHPEEKKKRITFTKIQ